MTYSAVPTIAIGDTSSAAYANTYIRDNLADHEARIAANTFSGCLLVRTTNQSIPSASHTLISWTAETVDQGGWFPSTGTTATVPSGALPSGFTTLLVAVSFNVPIEGNATGTRSVAVFKNGTSVGGFYGAAPDVNTMNVTGYVLTTAVPTDTFSIDVAQSSGGGLNLLGASLALTCSIARVGYF